MSEILFKKKREADKEAKKEKQEQLRKYSLKSNYDRGHRSDEEENAGNADSEDNNNKSRKEQQQKLESTMEITMKLTILPVCYQLITGNV